MTFLCTELSNYPFHVSARTRKSLELTTPLTTGANKIQIAARDASSAVSGRCLLNIQRTRSGCHPTRFIVSIGVSDYGDPEVNLEYAAKDANDIANAMAVAAGNFRDSRTTAFTDSAAVRANILAVKKFLRESKPEDEVIVFVAGHGVINDDCEYFFCPADFEIDGFRNGLKLSGSRITFRLHSRIKSTASRGHLSLAN